MNQEIYETKSCRGCKNTFHITNADIEFYEKVSPVFNWKKYSIPSPTLCPSCREQRRLTWRNERSLYKRKCDATGEDIISVYNDSSPYKVYWIDFWWSDKWDATNFSLEYDESISFLKQFWDLHKKVPQIPIVNDNNVWSKNCAYCNDFAFWKNCYMVIWSWHIEDSLYSLQCNHSKGIIDSFSVNDSNIAYECFRSQKIYNWKHLLNCENCTNCTFGFDLIWCNDCFWCFWLRNKSYCIFNKQYSKEEYQDKISKMNIWNANNLEKYKNEFKVFKLKHAVKPNYSQNCENSIWDWLSNCKNFFGFDVHNGKDCKFFDRGDGPKDCYDIIQSWGCNLCLEWVTPDDSFIACYSTWVWKSKYIYYSDNCHSSSKLFGCIGLKNKSYCILNKQYTKEEYETLVPKIIEKMREDWEWWEFFPSSMSQFGYNETVANEYFPLTKKEALEKWFNWSDYEAPFPKVEKIIPANKLPENITEIPDDILNWAIECEVTKKPFRIIKPELEFYRKHSIPIPKRHPDQRHMDRMQIRNPRHIYERTCDKCSKDVESTYAPEREEIVYCEECYNKEIY